MQLKVLRTGIFFFGQAIIDFFKYHPKRRLKVRPRRCHPVFYEKCVRTARVWELNQPIPAIRL